MIGALSRAVLLLPILLLVSPSPSQPIISSGTLGWAVVFVALLGFTNGYFGSLPMIVFSRKVKDALHLELAGQPMLPCCRHCPSVMMVLHCRHYYDTISFEWSHAGLCAGLCPHSPHNSQDLHQVLQ